MTSKINSVLLYPLFIMLFVLSVLLKQSTDLQVLTISYGLLCIVFLTLGFATNASKWRFSPLSLLIGLWVVWIFLQLSFDSVNVAALFGFFQCSLWVFAFIFITNMHRPSHHWQYFKITLGVIAIICALYALWQQLVLHDMPTALFDSRNTNAAFLMLTSLLLSGDLLSYPGYGMSNTQMDKRWRAVYQKSLVIVLFTINLAMFLSLSRGVILTYAFFLGTLCLVTMKSVNRAQLYKLLWIILAALLTLGVLAEPIISHRLDMLHHEKSRLVIWQGAWHLWQSTPWYGLGLSNFTQYYKAFSLPGDGSSLAFAHNDFLQLLIETGIPGAVLVLSIGIVLLISFFRYLKNPSASIVSHIRIIALFAAVGAFASHSFVDYNFYVVPMNILFGALLGYLHVELKTHHPILLGSFSPSNGKKRGVLLALIVLFLIISSMWFHLILFNYHTRCAERASEHHEYRLAIAENKKALYWLNCADVHSRLVDLYIQRAKIATVASKQHQFATLAEDEVQKAISINPYFSKSYFQSALIKVLFFNEQSKAYHLFENALHYDPHDCLARIVFSRFLIEQQERNYAQRILEQGLYYPITESFVQIYLQDLATLRSENGESVLAWAVNDKLKNLDPLQTDYSELAI